MSSTDIARGDDPRLHARWHKPPLYRARGKLPRRAGTAPERITASVRADLRYFTSELRITFFRRRNQLLLLVTALFPLLIGIGLKVAAPQGGGAGAAHPGRRAARRTSASSRATACSSRSWRCRCC